MIVLQLKRLGILMPLSVRKKSKAAGPNGLAIETFIYGGTKIWIHLSLLYTYCIKHCFLPAHFMDINIIYIYIYLYFAIHGSQYR